MTRSAIARPRIQRWPQWLGVALIACGPSAPQATSPARRPPASKASAANPLPSALTDLPNRCAGLATPPARLPKTFRVVAINTDGGTAALRYATLRGDGTLEQQEQHIECLARLIAELEPDVAFLSELHRETRYWPQWDMPGEIKRRVEQHLPGWELAFHQSCRLPIKRVPGRSAAMGNALLVRRAPGQPSSLVAADYDGDVDSSPERSFSAPLPTEILGRSDDADGDWRDADALCFSNPDAYIRHRGRQRRAIAAVVGGTSIVGVHLTPGHRNADIRRRQLTALADQVRTLWRASDATAHRRPTVVVGDFNERDTIFRPFASALPELRWTNATGASRPKNKLDHAFVADTKVVAATNFDATPFLNHTVVVLDIERPAP